MIKSCITNTTKELDIVLIAEQKFKKIQTSSAEIVVQQFKIE
ncbi:MAG: hypothetical protein ACTSQE_05025 [Candidatus Heimdallarchaeaceae archaeon]